MVCIYIRKVLPVWQGNPICQGFSKVGWERTDNPIGGSPSGIVRRLWSEPHVWHNVGCSEVHRPVASGRQHQEIPGKEETRVLCFRRRPGTEHTRSSWYRGCS